jgi:hypothetical protein
MEKMENKERFPLSHGTTTAISMDLLKKLLHLEFERSQFCKWFCIPKML